MSLETTLESLLIFLGLALPLSIAATNLALGALSAAGLLALFQNQLRWNRSWNAPLAALVAYAAAGVLCAAAGVDPKVSFHEAFKDGHKAWVLLTLLLAFSGRPNTRANWALAGGFAIAALIGLWQAFTEHPGGQWMRARAFVHPVTYGEMMALAALGALCVLASAREGKRGAPWFLALSLAALVLNQTRGAVLGLAAGFAAVCWLDSRLRRWLWRGAAALGAGLLVWELIPTGGRSLSAVLDPNSPFNPFKARGPMWGAAWDMFKDHPWTGVGPGNYHTLFSTYFHGTLEHQTDWGSAHNLFLHQLAERGLLGLAALGAALWVLTARALRRARRDPNAWALWAWGSMAAFIVMNLTEVAFQNELVATLLLFIWARAEAASKSYN
jgi:O-antigen ligase